MARLTRAARCVAALLLTIVLAAGFVAAPGADPVPYAYDRPAAPPIPEASVEPEYPAVLRTSHVSVATAVVERGFDRRSQLAHFRARWRLAPQTTLYRAVSQAELDDIATNGFRASERSMTGKFFAETPEHAAAWGRDLIYGKEGLPFHVVETRVPTSFADRLMRWDKLDGIGPARYVDDFLLDELNRVRSPIVDLPAIPRG